MVVAAVAGVGISIYLTTIHYAHVAPACTVTGIINCSNVLKSHFSTVPGTSVPITIPGMIWFLVSGGLAMMGLVSVWRGQDEPERLRLYQLVWAAGGMLFVLYLVYAEIVQLHNICEWCTGVHVLTLVTFILAWYRFTEDSRLRLDSVLCQTGASSRCATGRCRARAIPVDHMAMHYRAPLVTNPARGINPPGTVAFGVSSLPSRLCLPTGFSPIVGLSPATLERGCPVVRRHCVY